MKNGLKAHAGMGEVFLLDATFTDLEAARDDMIDEMTDFIAAAQRQEEELGECECHPLKGACRVVVQKHKDGMLIRWTAHVICPKKPKPEVVTHE